MCLGCEFDYYLDKNENDSESENDDLNKSKNKCVERNRIDECNSYHNDKNECIDCRKGFVLTSNNSKCIKEISDCKDYD